MPRRGGLLLALLALCLLAPTGCAGTSAGEPGSDLTPSPAPATGTLLLATPTVLREEPRAIEGIELVGHLGGKQATAVTVRGGTAYVGFGLQFAVLDLTSAASPRRLGYLVLPGPVVDIALVGPYAYVVTGHGAGMYVVDVSNPKVPVALTRTYTGPSLSAVVVSDGYAYVSSDAVHVLDLSDPTTPIEVAAFRPGGPGPAPRGEVAAVVAGHAYVVYNDFYARTGGFWIVDVSEPARPIQLGALPFAEPVHELVVAGDYAYLLLGRGIGQLAVVDVRDPQHPVEIHLPDDTTWRAQSLAVDGHILYLADPGRPDPVGSLQILDIVDPACPLPEGRYEGFAPEVPDLALVEQRAYLAVGDGLVVVDVSDPERPERVGNYRHDALPGSGRAVTVDGPYAYVAAGEAGLQVVDVSDPANPRAVAAYDTAGHSWDVALVGGYAFLADEYNGLRILDVTDPLHPAEVGAYDVPGPYEFFHGVAVDGPFVYVADGSITDTGLWVVDAADPVRPVPVSFLPLVGNGGEELPPRVEGVVAMGSTVYLAAGTAGLRVVDVSDPAAPVEVGAYDTPGRADNLVATGRWVYLMDGDLRIVDLGDRTAPALVGFYDVVDMLGTPHVAVQGRYAYLTGDGLRVVDVFDPGVPAEVTAHPIAMGDVAVAGDAVYVIGNGLFLLRTAPASGP
jgi:hypothetical protein